MSTTEPTATSDLEAVMRAHREGRPVDPDVRARIERRADEVREELIRRGFKDCAVDLVRAGRDDDDPDESDTNDTCKMSIITPSVSADLEAVAKAVAEGRPIDPDVRQRIEARAEAIREDMVRRGVGDIAVELIRAGRDE